MTEVPQPPPGQPADDQHQAGSDAPPEQLEESVDQALAVEQASEAGFHRGEALGARGANRIAARARATVIVLLGGPASGKTTLLAALYERFGRGPLNGHWFLGSETLHGFEKRCHRSIHHTGPGGEVGGHTAAGAPPWLHLRTSRQDDPEHQFELLLGDFSGEHHSRPIADGSIAAGELIELWRADHVCIVVDGGKLARADRREAERRFVLDLAKGVIRDPGALASQAALSIVLSKFDLVDEVDGARRFAEALFGEIIDLFPENSVGYIETAARSRTEHFPIGYGIGDLLARWTDRPALYIEHRLERSDPSTSDALLRFEAAP